ncbi:MAG TPA: DUF402 domain-containing protein [Chloroflexota bacterium]|nr:DUF402 domain-containing protein [Chloroflexota bacterium]
MVDLRPGDLVDVRALHSDGKAYRWWQDTVESVHNDYLVTSMPAGSAVGGTDRGWITSYVQRIFYWFARPFVLSEVYRPSGELLEIYVHIASPTTVQGRQVTYTDLELDVILRPGHAPEVVDEDEFAQAAVRYGYSPAFRSSCYRAVADALKLVARWNAAGISPEGR